MAKLFYAWHTDTATGPDLHPVQSSSQRQLFSAHMAVEQDHGDLAKVSLQHTFAFDCGRNEIPLPLQEEKKKEELITNSLGDTKWLCSVQR